jgi:hypothetical protein
MRDRRAGERIEQRPRLAIVIGRSSDHMALLRTGDGETVEVPVPDRLRDEIGVGASVELTADGAVDWRPSGVVPE